MTLSWCRQGPATRTSFLSLQKPNPSSFAVASSSAQNTVPLALQSYFLLGLPWLLHGKWPALPTTQELRRHHHLTLVSSSARLVPGDYVTALLV